MKREFAFVIDAERYLEAKGFDFFAHKSDHNVWMNKTGQTATVAVEMVHASSYKVNVEIL